LLEFFNVGTNNWLAEGEWDVVESTGHGWDLRVNIEHGVFLVLDEFLHNLLLLDFLNHLLNLDFLHGLSVDLGESLVLEHPGEKRGDSELVELVVGHWLELINVNVVSVDPVLSRVDVEQLLIIVVVEKFPENFWGVHLLSEHGLKDSWAHDMLVSLHEDLNKFGGKDLFVLTKEGVKDLWGEGLLGREHGVENFWGEGLLVEEGREELWGHDVTGFDNGVVHFWEDFLVFSEKDGVNFRGHDPLVSINLVEDDVLEKDILDGLGGWGVSSKDFVQVVFFNSEGEGVHALDNLFVNELDISNSDLFLSSDGINNLSEGLFLDLSRWEHLDIGQSFSDSLTHLVVDVHVAHHLLQEVLVVGVGGGGGWVSSLASIHGRHWDGPVTVVVSWLVSVGGGSGVWVESRSFIVNSLSG